MRDRWVMLLAVSLAVVSVAASSWMAWEVRGDYEAVSTAIEAAERNRDMQTLTTTWTDADGVSHTVATVRGDNEELDVWAARHAAAVASAQAKYPPA